MIRLTQEQFEDLKREQNPEVYTEEMVTVWIAGLNDTLIKAEVSELDEFEKAEVDEFNEEFKSFTKVQVISSPEATDLNKGLRYTNFYIREQQVDWDIQKSEDGEETKSGVYRDTTLNRKLNRVGLKFGEKVYKSEDDELEKGGEGSRGGKVIGHTRSGRPIYENYDHKDHKDFSKEDHRDAAEEHEKRRLETVNSKDFSFNRQKHKQLTTHKQGYAYHWSRADHTNK